MELKIPPFLFLKTGKKYFQVNMLYNCILVYWKYIYFMESQTHKKTKFVYNEKLAFLEQGCNLGSCNRKNPFY